MDNKDNTVEQAEQTNSNPYFLECEAQLTNLINPTPMDKDNIGDRIFGSLNGKGVIAITISETFDSFLVAFPVNILHGEDGDVDIKMLVPGSRWMARLMKSAVSIVSTPDDRSRYYYYKFLSGMPDLSSQLLDEIRFNKINDFINEIENKDRSTKVKTKPEKSVMPYKSKVKH